jgi:hypothetical protein
MRGYFFISWNGQKREGGLDGILLRLSTGCDEAASVVHQIATERLIPSGVSPDEPLFAMTQFCWRTAKHVLGQ